MLNFFQNLQGSPPRLPKLTIAQRVIDKIVANATVYATETGEALVGLVVKPPDNGEPELYVLDTIPPDDSAVRMGAYFEQGDDLQGDIFKWLFANWQQFRKRKSLTDPRFDVALVHMGDWHKHPGTMVEPSWGDYETAREQIFDRSDKTPQLLVVLATVWDDQSRPDPEADPAAAAELAELASVAGVTDEVANLERAEQEEKRRYESGEPLKVPLSDVSYVRIDCWYLSRSVRRFARLTPTVVPDDQLPRLAPLSWHLRSPERMKDEVEALKREGYSISLDRYDTDHLPPLEVCMSLARRDSQHILIIATQPEYPAMMPKVMVTPMSAMKDIPEGVRLIDRLWSASKPLPENAYPKDWTPDKTIADLARAVEANLAKQAKPEQ
jgi:hypothetical protein